MKYKLFCSDFDGTLVRTDGTISDKTKAAIHRYMQAGGIFTICSGRMLSSILPRAREMGLTDGLVVACQGGVIAELKTGKVLKNVAFRKKDAIALLRLLEQENHHIHAYTPEGLFANRRDELLTAYEKMCGVRATVPREPLSKWAEKRGESVNKILVMLEPEKRDALRDKLESTLGEQYFITTSHAYLVEVTPRGVDKGSAVRFLSEYFSVPREETAAIGDELNDLPLLEAAGGKFTVENGAAKLKKIARVMPSCDEDGVACALDIAMETKGGTNQ